MGKSGFATIIGRPNVGKSTLMSTLIGQKLAITSYKPQTTRRQMRTVYTEERGQIVFLDTPGMHAAQNALGDYMEKAAEKTLQEVDCILFLTEPKLSIAAEDRQVLERVKKASVPVILVINKTDTVRKDILAAAIGAWAHEYSFAAVVPLSARTGAGTKELLDEIFRVLSEGQPFYDEDTVTDVNERDIVGEIIREKALRLLQDEVPHGIAVTVETMKERPASRGGKICDIEASIITERESHKGIIIGRSGEMLRKIGTAARTDIENMLEMHVNLKLFVKVRRDWRENYAQMKNFGYDIKKL